MNERLALGPRVAISGSIPPDDELARYGWSAGGIEGALHTIVKQVLAAGGNIAHGFHPSFTRVIRQEVEAMNPRPGEPRRVHLLASRYFVTDEPGFRKENEGFAVLTLSGTPNMDRSEAGREPALAEMRQALFDSCDAAIFIGGRLHEESQVIPGVVREFQLARAHALPIYFATATGGRARLLFEQEIRPHTEVLRNGLTFEQNLQLATEADRWSAARMIVDDLHELASARRQDPPAGPDVDHLKIIQAVIARLAGNAFSIKGWTLTLVSALLVLGDKTVTPWSATLAFIPIITFGPLDAYYQMLETRFRKLYELVLEEAPLPPSRRRIPQFSLDLRLVAAESPSLGKICKRPSVWAFHGALLGIVVLVLCLAIAGVFQKPAAATAQGARQAAVAAPPRLGPG